MRLWTIQPVSVYETLMKTGVYHCDGTLSNLLNDDISNFQNAYQWMIEQMKERTGMPPDEVSYPVWAWYLRDWKHKKPDLRESGYAERGTEMVCLTIEIPKESVLLSDFDAWHFVLNQWYFPRVKTEEEWDEKQTWFESLTKKQRDQVMKESWNQIFDITPCNEEWDVMGRYVQATFWELKKEQIKKVQFFKAK